ncbi:SAM-dependent methyltransferase, partial [Streptomyces goshikiensis]
DREATLRPAPGVGRPGARVGVSHPIGRAARGARHGRELTPDDLRAEHNLGPLLSASGWDMTSYADEDERFLALAVRRA